MTIHAVSIEEQFIRSMETSELQNEFQGIPMGGIPGFGGKSDGRYRMNDPVEVVCGEFIFRYTQLESTEKAADALGKPLSYFLGALKRCPDLYREYQLLRDRFYSDRLLEDGTECKNGCGPMFSRCSTCGERKSR